MMILVEYLITFDGQMYKEEKEIVLYKHKKTAEEAIKNKMISIKDKKSLCCTSREIQIPKEKSDWINLVNSLLKTKIVSTINI